MDVKLTDDEVLEIASVIVNRVAAGADLPDRDRALLKRWRSSYMRLGSDDFQELVRKVNEDLATQFKRRERSQLQKHDWND
jgi:hypothetical protein